MDEERYDLSAGAMQLAVACDLCTAVYLMALGRGGPGRFYPLALLLYAPLLYGADRLFLRRERSLLSLILVNGGAALGLFAAVLLIDGPGDWASLIFTGIFCLCPAVTGGKMALKAPDLHDLIVCVDLSVVLLLLFTGYTAATGVSLVWTLPAMAGCAASILGLSSRRVSRRLSPRDWGLWLLAFGALLFVMWVLVRFAAAPAGQGLVSLWTALVAAGRFVLGLLWRAFVYLLSLMPEPGGGQGQSQETVWRPEGDMEAEMGSPAAAVVLLVVCLAVAVTLLGWAVMRCRGLRIGGRTTAAEKSGNRRGRISFLEGLARMLAAWKERFFLRAFLWRNRNTPEGLFCILVRRCGVGPWRKRPGETPREFLSRLRAGADGDPDLARALDGLIPAVDSALYAKASPGQTVPLAGLIRRRMGRAIRRQYLREHIKHLRR